MKKIKCILCDGKLVKQIVPRVRDSKNHKIIKCKKCGHVQLYPIPSKNDDREFYNKDLQLKNTKYSGTINELRIKNMEDTLRRAAFIRKIVPKKGSILEIGSGYGFFLEEMNRHGFKITGIEISQERIKRCKKVTNVKILNVDLNEQLPDLPNFDAIVVFLILLKLFQFILHSIINQRASCTTHCCHILVQGKVGRMEKVHKEQLQQFQN